MNTLSEFNSSLQIIKGCSEKIRIDERNNWIKSIERKMTSEEEADYNVSYKKALVIFTETECGKRKLEFLNSYLRVEDDIKMKLRTDLLSIFSTAEFAVLAVRQRSKEIVELALDSFEISIKINNDFRDDITSLTLIYNAIKIIGLKPDAILDQYADKSQNATLKKLVADFLTRKPKDKTLWCMGYETENDKEFGFVWIGGDSDYKSKKPKFPKWKFW